MLQYIEEFLKKIQYIEKENFWIEIFFFYEKKWGKIVDKAI